MRVTRICRALRVVRIFGRVQAVQGEAHRRRIDLRRIELIEARAGMPGQDLVGGMLVGPCSVQAGRSGHAAWNAARKFAVPEVR